MDSRAIQDTHPKRFSYIEKQNSYIEKKNTDPKNFPDTKKNIDYSNQACDANTKLHNSIIIGGKHVNNRMFLAPMAGLGHVAFRELLAEFGGFGLLFTGMCSAKAVPTENPDHSTVFKWREEELPWLVCQLFGSEPKSMVNAAKRIQREGFFGVDLNFGCCAAAICKKGSGAALLRNQTLSMEIVSRVRDAVSIPLFVKFRTGWENNPDQSAQMAAMFQKSGADALVFHPRVAPDRRARPPKWEHIKYIKNAVSIPVFGNGNIFDENDCKKMLHISGCDGVSIGRMAVAKPWIFAHLNLHSRTPALSDHENDMTVFKTNNNIAISHQPENFTAFQAPNIDSPNIYHYTLSRFITLLLKHHDEKTSIKFFKKFVPYFAAGFKFGHKLSQKLLKCENTDEIRQNIDSLFIPLPETISRPNLNLFS
ncbi:tRNA-dihydrouridine synthase [Desulfamplus magnetovallimortis]|uniref:tRNA-dihydrouridine synthase n=1 Tax=Desulfamplus magnetovallimortis TaxID=1246637 RepID=A0A1W1HIG2_9BACT|nr:tRNA-dihydrouridine synthase family protein [Desulfamplus magnetovallimortis]SLM32205.1 tRNA-dihydrouridine synthase [Desulfamplus magnetovallimortis]